MNKWVRKAIACVIILLLVTILTLGIELFGGGNYAKASIVPLNLNKWAQLQRTYFSEHNQVGATTDIGWRGYSDPDNVNGKCKEKKECFSFYSKFINAVPGFLGVPGSPGKSTFCAKNNEDIGGCKAGNEWCIRATDEGNIKYIEPEDKSCIELTPTNLFLK
jgi:hypothetical protein